MHQYDEANSENRGQVTWPVVEGENTSPPHLPHGLSVAIPHNARLALRKATAKRAPSSGLGKY